MARAAEMRLESSGRFGTAFHKALVERQMSLVEFARNIDANYEHLRKVLRGLVAPSKNILPVICKSLGMNLEEMKVLVTQDIMEKKWGAKTMAAASGRTLPHASEFDALVPHLSEAEIAGLLAQMKVMVKQRKVNLIQKHHKGAA